MPADHATLAREGLPDRRDARRAWLGEIRETLRLAWPLILAQLLTIALNTTDVVMLGWLGPEPLGAGSLAFAVLHPLMMFGFGVCTAASPMIAQARGARAPRSVRRTVRQGLWVAAALSLVLVPILALAEPALRAIGQPPYVAALAGDYLRYAALMLPFAMAFVVLRGLVAAFGETRIVLWITAGGVLLNALLDYALIFGRLGAPRLEMVGAGVATALTYGAIFGLLLLHVLRRAPYRRFRILGRLWRPDWPRFGAILRLGTPIGLTLAAESGLFAAAALLMGWLGPDPLAAHAAALQLASIAFMTPLGLSHATTVRVGLAYGAGDAAGVRRAGWASVGLALAAMSVSATLFWFAPGPLVGLFLEGGVPASMAVSFLAVAALFQLVDGAQVTAAAALRGLSDTRTPMVIALFCYWGVGLPCAWALAFPAGLEGVGVWAGLAAGLGVAAVSLCLRFFLKTRDAASASIERAPARG